MLLPNCIMKTQISVGLRSPLSQASSMGRQTVPLQASISTCCWCNWTSVTAFFLSAALTTQWSKAGRGESTDLSSPAATLTRLSHMDGRTDERTGRRLSNFTSHSCCGTAPEPEFYRRPLGWILFTFLCKQALPDCWAWYFSQVSCLWTKHACEVKSAAYSEL